MPISGHRDDGNVRMALLSVHMFLSAQQETAGASSFHRTTAVLCSSWGQGDRRPVRSDGEQEDDRARWPKRALGWAT